MQALKTMTLQLSAVLVVCIISGCGRDADKQLTLSNLQKIEADMTLVEVELLLGTGRKKEDKEVAIRTDMNSPYGQVITYAQETTELYVWEGRHKRVIVVFDEGRVLASDSGAHIYAWGFDDEKQK